MQLKYTCACMHVLHTTITQMILIRFPSYKILMYCVPYSSTHLYGTWQDVLPAHSCTFCTGMCQASYTLHLCIHKSGWCNLLDGNPISVSLWPSLTERRSYIRDCVHLLHCQTVVQVHQLSRTHDLFRLRYTWYVNLNKQIIIKVTPATQMIHVLSNLGVPRASD